MNTPIQSQTVKSPETPSREASPGFFLPTVPSTGDTPSFDSFISKEHHDDPRSKELEEEEKEKKRIEAQQLAAALAPSQTQSNSTPLSDEATLSPQQTDSNQSPDTSQTAFAKPEKREDISSKQQKPSENSEASIKEPSQTSIKEPSQTSIKEPSQTSIKEPSQTSIKEPSHPQKNEIDTAEITQESEPPTDPMASGTDHATNSEDMFSLAAMDSLDAGLPVAVPKDPSITTSGRLNSFTVADRIATTSAVTSASGSNTESNSGSNLGQLGTGAPATASTLRTTSTPKSPEATASSMLRSLRVEIEKFTQTNRSQLQIDLPVSDTESVKVRLSMRGNELHTVFVTGSAELREALQKAWPEFSQNSRDRGFNFNDPSFQQSANQQDTTSGNPQDRRRAADTTPAPAVSAITKPRKAPSPQPSTRPGGVSLWA